MDILLDIQLSGDDRPLETHCRVYTCDGKPVVYYQTTDADITYLVSEKQMEMIHEKLREVTK